MNQAGGAAPRILYVLSLFPCWSETFILREMHALRAHGAEIAILSLKPHTETMVQPRAQELLPVTMHPPGDVTAMFALLGLLLRHPLKVGGFLLQLIVGMATQPMNLFRSIGAVARAAALLPWAKRFNADIIHAPWATYPATVAWFYSRLLDRPFSFTSRAHDIFVEDQMLAQKLARADLAVTITRNNVRHLGQWMKQPGAVPLHVVHSALDLPGLPFEAGQRDPHTLLSVGRMDPIKGFDVLLDALALLKQRGVAFHSVIVGEGPEQDALMARRDALGLKDDVTFAGAIPNQEVRAAMASSTLMVAPCVVTPEGNADGIPNVLTEAMATGLPVVSTRVSGIPELIEHDVNGSLVEQRDPVALADAVSRMLDDPEARRRHALAGRAKVEAEFDVSKESARLLALMKQTIARRAGSRSQPVASAAEVA